MFFIFMRLLGICIFFFFNDTATTEIYTLSLHDALPISVAAGQQFGTVSGIIETVDNGLWLNEMRGIVQISPEEIDRKSTRLNSSHTVISYAVFCLKKKKRRSMALNVKVHEVPSRKTDIA